MIMIKKGYSFELLQNDDKSPFLETQYVTSVEDRESKVLFN